MREMGEGGQKVKKKSHAIYLHAIFGTYLYQKLGAAWGSYASREQQI